MKKYLRELEIAGMILIGIGIVIAHTAGYHYGAWPCGAGMLVGWLSSSIKDLSKVSLRDHGLGGIRAQTQADTPPQCS